MGRPHSITKRTSGLLGACSVIYELFSRQKAFSSDWAVTDYEGSGELWLLSALTLPQFSDPEMITDETPEISGKFEKLMQKARNKW